jgi:hypothetical protein
MNHNNYIQQKQVNNLLYNEKKELKQPHVNQAYARLVSMLDDRFSFSKLAYKVVKFFKNVKIFKPSQDQKIANLMNIEKKLTDKSNQLIADLDFVKINAIANFGPKKESIPILNDSQFAKLEEKKIKIQDKLDCVQSEISSIIVNEQKSILQKWVEEKNKLRNSCVDEMNKEYKKAFKSYELTRLNITLIEKEIIELNKNLTTLKQGNFPESVIQSMELHLKSLTDRKKELLCEQAKERDNYNSLSEIDKKRRYDISSLKDNIKSLQLTIGQKDHTDDNLKATV